MVEGEKISGSSSWTRDDDIAFERALAIYPDESESRWEKIAQVVPGKTLEEIREHYKILVYDVIMIESGCVPLPDYDSLEETNSEKERSISECGNNGECEYDEQQCKPKLKQKRRKGIAWTAIEHSQFLLGLEKYGKGDWRSISRYFVVTRTPIQVASHAQKYFARLRSQTNTNQKRTSIHDITVAETSRNIPTKPITCQNKNYFNVAAASSNTQPSLDLPIQGTPFVWNSQAASQPSVSIPMYGTQTIGQSMVRPMLLPFGTDMNRLAPPPMAYHSAAYPSVPNAPSRNITYTKIL